MKAERVQYRRSLLALGTVEAALFADVRTLLGENANQCYKERPFSLQNRYFWKNANKQWQNNFCFTSRWMSSGHVWCILCLNFVQHYIANVALFICADETNLGKRRWRKWFISCKNLESVIIFYENFFWMRRGFFFLVFQQEKIVFRCINGLEKLGIFICFFGSNENLGLSPHLTEVGFTDMKKRFLEKFL